MLGILGRKFRAGVGKGAARIMLQMPFNRHDVAQKRVERLLVIDQALVEETVGSTHKEHRRRQK